LYLKYLSKLYKIHYYKYILGSLSREKVLPQWFSSVFFKFIGNIFNKNIFLLNY